ncbi:MAG: hypothetical protein ACQEQF_05855 [Bacillota bacterium]
MVRFIKIIKIGFGIIIMIIGIVIMVILSPLLLHRVGITIMKSGARILDSM